MKGEGLNHVIMRECKIHTSEKWHRTMLPVHVFDSDVVPCVMVT